MSLPGNVATSVVEAVVVGEVTGKKWYQSKTLWTNIVASGILAAELKWGFPLSPIYQMFALAGINIALRFVTKQSLL
jgi:hypothetical protein